MGEMVHYQTYADMDERRLKAEKQLAECRECYSKLKEWVIENCQMIQTQELRELIGKGCE